MEAAGDDGAGPADAEDDPICDTHAAILSLLGSLPPTGAPPPPPCPPVGHRPRCAAARIVLRHQLYTIVEDRTDVDRSLVRMRTEGEARLAPQWPRAPMVRLQGSW